MMKTIAIIVLAGLAAPAAALAQTTGVERRTQAFDNIRQMEQTMRLDEMSRQLDNLEFRQRTEQNLQTLARQPVVLDNPYARNTYAAPITPAQRAAEDRARDAELAASNARLRAISAQQRAAQAQ